MNRIDEIFHHDEVSEKSIERYLVAKVELLGGKALKYYNAHTTGYPDRLCLLPVGVTFWVELKSKGKKLRPLQAHCRDILRSLGQDVYTCDSIESVDRVLLRYKISH